MISGLYRYKAVAVENYDGDSLKCDVDLGMNSWLLDKPVRLYGIDTPEIRGKSDIEKRLAITARDLISDRLGLGGQIATKEFILETMKDQSGKYGRLLARIHVPELDGSWLCLNDLLIDMRLAQAYFGKGERVDWTDWYEDNIGALKSLISDVVAEA